MGKRFQIGDRVVCVEADSRLQTTHHHIGKVGTIIGQNGKHGGLLLWQVEYDEIFWHYQHNCGGLLTNNHGWNHYGHEIERYIEPSTNVEDLL